MFRILNPHTVNINIVKAEVTDIVEGTAKAIGEAGNAKFYAFLPPDVLRTSELVPSVSVEPTALSRPE
jgi:hypothetical protein